MVSIEIHSAGGSFYGTRLASRMASSSKEQKKSALRLLKGICEGMRLKLHSFAIAMAVPCRFI